MYGNLIGKHLTHCSKGHGIIIDHKESLNVDKDYFTVKYDDEDIKDSTFVYPDVFDGYAKFDDESDQKQAIEYVENIKLKERLAKEEAKRLREEEELRKLEEKKTKTKIENKKLYIAKQKKRYEEKRLLEPYPTWLVFQGTSWEKESTEQFIYVSDIKNDNCIEMPFWKDILELKMDDVIIHCKGQHIYAISQVVLPVNSDVPSDEGYKVECDYIILNNPLDLNEYRDQIIEYKQEYRSPFNKNGTGNQGYLFPLDYDLAQFFIKEIVKTNDLKQKYIQDIIDSNL